MVVTAFSLPVTPPAIGPPVVELVNTFTGTETLLESISDSVPSGFS
jgi:hypothetical protein